LHDPELIPIGLLLRIRGKRVIFDSHENYPKGMLSKQYLPAWLRPGVAWTYALFERFACRFFDAVIGANPWITEHFDRFHPRAVHIDNYPRLEEFPERKAKVGHSTEVCYVGALSAQRGIVQMVKAIGL